MLKSIYARIIRSRWELGFVKGGLDGVFSDGDLKVDWVINPFRDRWFADPFILDMTDDYVYLLAEEFQFKTKKGRIAKLSINRKSLQIEEYSIVLEQPFHLSFPNILRKEGRVFVYPESCLSGRLDLYEYNSDKDKLEFIQTICDDSIWDSSMSGLFGETLLFTANRDDYHLDIYKWDSGKSRFVYHQSVVSKLKDSRMAGALFQYKGVIYCPSQNCEKNYGGGVEIKTVEQTSEGFAFHVCKKLSSPHKTRRIALHTLNEYKGLVVIDVGGYDFPILGSFLHRIIRKLKKV